ncbi:transporter [Massilia sp. CMS3.1]|uniref:transporter n=1 Tax=Massilia sp. CMS3.1 TaxID=3373083 RepID=UPI003EE75679
MTRSAVRHTASLLVTLVLAAPAAFAADEPIATDRPDFVESSDVVGKGRLQVETSALLERDKSDGARARALSTPTLLRVGVTDAVELRVETDGRSVVRDMDRNGQRSTTAAWNDTSVGMKWHAADGGGTLPSVGVLLHADLPSGTRAVRGQGVRPSLRVVGEWELPAGMSLGVMPGVGVERNDAGARYRYGILGVVVGKELGERVRGFAEIAMPQIAHVRDGGTQASFDIGAAWLLSDTVQLDTMLARGLNRRTPDLAWTVGLSFKL